MNVKKAKPTGYILFENASVVCIATLKSGNRKTGNMVQTWILRRDEDPVAAIQSGGDVAICGDCPLRGVLGQKRTCYVNVGQAPLAIWKTYRRGGYEPISDWSVFAGRMVRMGAYGDPAMVPVSVWKLLLEQAKGWTGYTHQWNKDWAQGLKGLCMASVGSPEEHEMATAMGWRTFRVRMDDNAPMAADEIQCPNTTRGVSCEDCGLCRGSSLRARSIVIEAHGSGKKYLK